MTGWLLAEKKDNATTISHDRWWSCRFVTQGLTAASDCGQICGLCVRGRHRSPLPLQDNFVLLGHGITLTHRRVPPNVPLSRGSPGPCGVSPAGAAHPHLHPWPWHAIKSSSRHPLWVPQGQAQPRGFSRVTLSQGPSHNLRTGLSEETQHSCTLLRSPCGRRNGLGPAAAPGRGFGLGGEYKSHPHNTAQCPWAPACDSPGSGDARGCSRTLSPCTAMATPLLAAETPSKQSRNCKDLLFFLFYFFSLFYFCSNKTKRIVWWRKHILLGFLRVPGCAFLSAGRITYVQEKPKQEFELSSASCHCLLLLFVLLTPNQMDRAPLRPRG